MSDFRPTTIERAFELARAGMAATLQDIALRLQNEGYLDVNHQLNGPLIRKQLRKIRRVITQQRAGITYPSCVLIAMNTLSA